MRSRNLLVMLGSFGTLAVACEAIPELNFPPDSTTSGPDGSSEPESDGSTPGRDGGSSGTLPDGGGDAAPSPCGPAPAAATTCCGKAWCGGNKCDATGCPKCEDLNCGGGTLCCTKGNNASCQTTCT